jgi:hypothetical protein
MVGVGGVVVAEMTGMKRKTCSSGSNGNAADSAGERACLAVRDQGAKG